MDVNAHFLENSIGVFTNYKKLGERSFDQLQQDADFHFQPDVETNSIAIIVQHLHGNMLSRWTDFLTTDGEKPTRMRDAEFEQHTASKAELLELWTEGWTVLMDTLQHLQASDMLKTVRIRGEELTVMQAILRQIAHYSYHIGQIVFIAKQLKSGQWKSLSIPRNKSAEHSTGTYLDNLK